MFVLLSLLTVCLFSAPDVSAASTGDQSSYQTAFLYFLPDYEPHELDKPEVRGCAKLGYTITIKDCAAPRILKDKCPAGNYYKECYCAGDPNCDTSWSLSSSNPRPSSVGASMTSCMDCRGKMHYEWTCSTSDCDDYQLSSCPSHGICSQCCDGKYKLDSCSSGYRKSGDSCEEECNSSSPDWCAVHSACHGDCCAKGTIASCDTRCGGSGCCAKICSDEGYSSSRRPPSPLYTCTTVPVGDCTCYDCVSRPVPPPPHPDCPPGVECGDAGCFSYSAKSGCEDVCLRCNSGPTPCSGVTCPTDLTCTRGCKTYSDATSCCESVCTECKPGPTPPPPSDCPTGVQCGDAGCARLAPPRSGCERVCAECNPEPDPCDGVTCSDGKECKNGTCVCPSGQCCPACTGGKECKNGTCVDPDPCAGVTCPTGIDGSGCYMGCNMSTKTECCPSVCTGCWCGAGEYDEGGVCCSINADRTKKVCHTPSGDVFYDL